MTTRGRAANHLYIDTTTDADNLPVEPTPQFNADEVLPEVLGRTGRQLSATQSIHQQTSFSQIPPPQQLTRPARRNAAIGTSAHTRSYGPEQ